MDLALPDDEMRQWPELYLHKWFPPQVKSHPQHEPHNALIMCKKHHMSFNAYDFFIRFVPAVSLVPFFGSIVQQETDSQVRVCQLLQSPPISAIPW